MESAAVQGVLWLLLGLAAFAAYAAFVIKDSLSQLLGPPPPPSSPVASSSSFTLRSSSSAGDWASWAEESGLTEEGLELLGTEFQAHCPDDERPKEQLITHFLHHQLRMLAVTADVLESFAVASGRWTTAASNSSEDD